ncbi:MAG TPA: DUF4167 domain-containing protein [Paracoccaceae bacterium]|nr:DUF4167 domain-containing protein [Paracoccaceae bacterium]
MRSAQKNNRSRGRSNRKSGGGGGGGNIINRVFDSAGPEGKVRGTPQQIIDKYLSLARDTQTSGDRVMSENFLQHAEHYQRMLMQATAQAEQNRRDQPEGSSESDGDEREGTQGDRRDEREGGQGNQRDERESGQGNQRDEREGGQGNRRRQQPRRGVEADGQGESEGEIGGMTMIDSPGGTEDLLVVSEDVSQTQPRRNGDGRRRRPRQSSEGGQGSSESSDDTPNPAQQEG